MAQFYDAKLVFAGNVIEVTTYKELEEISKKNKTIKDIFYKIKGAEKSEQI